jgi:uncharacterized protein
MKFLKNLSRRSMIGATAAAASALPALAQPAPAPAGPPGAPPGGGRGGRGAGGPRVTPGGHGPIRVLFTSSYHPFDRENLFLTLDGFGDDITWSHIEHPAAEAFYDPKLAARFDVFLFYDAFAGRPNPPPPPVPFTAPVPGAPRPARAPAVYRVPTAEEQANLKQLMQNGDKGFVFFHHSLASWCHSWPAGVNGSNAYVEVMGAAADWGDPLLNIRGVDYPPSGFKGKTHQHVTVVDKNHPITAGVDDYDIVDECYLCPMFEDSVHPLLRTDYKQIWQNYSQAQAPSERFPNGHPPGSNMSGWYKAAERSPVVYIQHGHDNEAWSNPAFKKLLLNSIKWAASPESKTWAHANAKRIFV